jgi:hypothetical protein
VLQMASSRSNHLLSSYQYHQHVASFIVISSVSSACRFIYCHLISIISMSLHYRTRLTNDINIDRESFCCN